MRPLMITALMLASTTSLLADPVQVTPGSVVSEIRRESALASREVYYNLRELPGSRSLYLNLYEIYAVSSRIPGEPCLREVMVLDELVHDAEFILERMQAPVTIYGPPCQGRRVCTVIQPDLQILQPVSLHIGRLRQLVDGLAGPPAEPGVIPHDNLDQPVKPGTILRENFQPQVQPPLKRGIPDNSTPEQEVPQKEVPRPLEEKPELQEPAPIEESPVVEERPLTAPVPGQYEEKPEVPETYVPRNEYPEIEENPLPNTVPQQNPTDILITPTTPSDVSQTTPSGDNRRANTNPNLNRDEYLPEVLPSTLPETAPGPALVAPIPN